MQNTAIGKALSRSRNALTTKMLLVMRMTAFLLILFFQASAFTESAAQVTLKESSATLEKVLKTIQAQSSYDLVFDKALLQAKGKPVAVNVTNVPVKEALDKVFAQQELLTYSLSGKIISVMEKKINIPSPEQFIPTPTIDVKGRVVNEKGEGVVASVIIKGTTRGVSTDDEGYFLLKDIEDNAVLVISALNIEKYEIKLNGKNDLGLIRVRSKSVESEGVVVSSGYQQIKVNEVAGSYERVNSDLINRKPTPDIISRLENVSGILFDKRNPNNVRLQIRGLATLDDNRTQPLIVLDDFPFSGNITDINPNDVDNITILRDAAAASIWGVRAGNGVIVITTKKGRLNKPLSVSITSNLTFSSKPNLFQQPIIPSKDFVDLETYLFNKGAFNADINNTFQWPALTPAVEILLQRRSGLISASDSANRLNALRQQDGRNDFSKYVYKNPFSQQHFLNMNGGSGVIAYNLSFGYDKSIFNLKGNENDRITIRIENIITPFKKLTIKTTASYAASSAINNSLGEYGDDAYNLYSVATGSLIRALPVYSRLVDDLGQPLAIDRYRQGFVDTVGRGRLLDWRFRPLDELSLNDNVSKQRNLLANIGLSYQFGKGLSGQLLYQYQLASNDNRNHHDVKTYFSRDLINMYTNLNGATPATMYPVPIGGITDYLGGNIHSQNFRGQLNYDRRYALKHQLTGMAGIEIRSVNSRSDAYRTYGNTKQLNIAAVDYVNFYPRNVSSPNTVPIIAGSSDLRDRFVSLYMHSGYTYDKRFSFSTSIRRDASIFFGVNTNDKWNLIWSIGGGWTISNEKFYKFAFLPYLRARATFGYSGNVDASKSPYVKLTYFTSAANPTINVPFASVTGAPNPDLRWERVRQINLAIDFATKNDIIVGSIDFFEKKSYDLISSQTLDPTTGYSSISTNSAGIKGSGVELRLQSKNINHVNFRWETNLNLNHVNYKVNRLLLNRNTKGFVSDGAVIFPIEGYNPYVVVSYKWSGLNPLNGDPIGWLNGNKSSNWDSIVNFSPLDNQVVHGSALPTVFGNLLNTFLWKGLSLSANISYRLGYYFRRPSIRYSSLFFGSSRGHIDYLNRWQKAGDELVTNVPSLIYPNPSVARDDFYQNSEALVEKGDHIRLEDIGLSYSIVPCKGSAFKSIRINCYVGNLNLILWKANKIGLDPVFPTGIKTPASFSFGTTFEF